MNKIRETLRRLTRAGGSGSTTSGSSVNSGASGVSAGTHLTKTTTASTLQRTASTARDSREDLNRGPIVLYDGVRGGQEGVDIVFVHGLNGHRVASWTKNNVCWPRDLLGKDLGRVRVISWGWISSGFSDQAESLLLDVAKIRVGTTRPIIFVGHGLGGFVIKEALVTAALSRIYGSHTELGNVYPRTLGCIFLGTPHLRTAKQSLGNCIAITALMSPRLPSPQFLRSLKDIEETFERQHSTFLMISRDIKIVCVREEIPTTIARPRELLGELDSLGFGKTVGQISLMVAKESATYSGMNVNRDEYGTNHQDLARFTSHDDPGYVQLVARMAGIAADPDGPTPAEIEARAMRSQEILDALYFDTMNERESRIERAYGETCEWIMSPEVSPFNDFLQSKESILWISGKAGSGKSTLMKHAWRSTDLHERLSKGWAKGGDLHMACFFMFEGGNRIQKSYEGFLRSVLYQVLSARRDLIRIAFPSFFDGPWPPPVHFTSITNLNQGFYSLFAHLSETLRLFVFIDGIDEYRIMERKDHYRKEDLDITYGDDATDESWGRSRWISDSHAEITKLLNSMTNNDTVKFVVTSRELPVFNEAFADRLHIRLHDHTEKAIALYVEGRLLDEAPGLPDTTNLCAQIAKKSKGDVLWARLALDMVVDCSLRTLRPTLDSLPERLGGAEGLYMRMMENLSAPSQQDAYRIFQLVTRALQPPSIVTLALAAGGYLDPSTDQLRVAQDSAQPFTPSSLQQLTDQLQRRLQTSCAGLLVAEAEPTPGTSSEAGQRVVFSHQTSKEWVGRSDIWLRLPGTTIMDDAEFDFALLSGCIRHLKAFEIFGSPVLVWPNPRFLSDAWLLVAHALRYAERIDGKVDEVESYFDLLDEMDRTCQRAWLKALQNRKLLYVEPSWYETKLPVLMRRHWAGYEPMDTGKPPKRKDFMTLAVQANLVRYVAYKLGRLEAETRRAKAQDLLSYVVSPSAEGFSACVNVSGDYLDFHHDMPDTRMLELLFDAGADVKDADKLWTKALRTGRRYFSRGSVTMSHLMETGASRRLMLNRERWVASIKSLLQHGANPDVEIQVQRQSGTDESRSTITVAAMDMIRETLEGEPEYAFELSELETLLRRRRSLAS